MEICGSPDPCSAINVGVHFLCAAFITITTQGESFLFSLGILSFIAFCLLFIFLDRMRCYGTSWEPLWPTAARASRQWRPTGRPWS